MKDMSIRIFSIIVYGYIAASMSATYWKWISGKNVPLNTISFTLFLAAVLSLTFFITEIYKLIVNRKRTNK